MPSGSLVVNFNCRNRKMDSMESSSFGYLNSVKQAVVELDLDIRRINRLDSVEDPARILTRGFRKAGWAVEKKSGNPPLRLVSPDGTTELKRQQGKVWRHPASTEMICKEKDLTRRLLELKGVPVPRGMSFDEDALELADAIRPAFGSSVVVKPSNAGGSAGVTVGVTDGVTFREAWNRAKSIRKPGRNIVVEEQVPGIEVRCYVVGQEVVSAILRVQPFVVGDGTTEIAQLIEGVANHRSANAWYDRARPIPDEEFLAHYGLNLTSTPKDGEVVILNPFHLFQLGSVTVEVLDRLNPTILRNAVRAVRAVPGLEVAAVDFLTEDFTAAGGKVIEMNTAPALSQHLFPAFGDPRPVVQQIVKYYSESIGG